MFRRIVVPLDGSTQAEQALPVAVRIARASHGTIVLLHAVKPLIEYGYTPHPLRSSSFTESLQEQDLERAQNYLTTVSHLDVLTGMKIGCVALIGLAAPVILAYTRIHSADLIVMPSHGSTGVQRWAIGSVTQKVVRLSTVPVLVLHSESSGTTEFQHPAAQSLRVLVALDGSPLAETVLLPAIQVMSALAASMQGELHLIRIVKRASEYKHRKIDVNALEQAQQEAANYLGTTANGVSAGIAAEYGVKVTWSELVSDDVAATLIEAAEVGIAEGPIDGCDMLALATHGRTGLQRWMVGSITERILGNTTLPLLVVRPQEMPTTAREQAAKGLKVGIAL